MARSSPDLDTFPTFGSLLAYLRRREQLTQLQLSIATGYSEAQISRLEGDKRPCSRETILALLVPALHLEEEPEVVARLLALGEEGRGEGEKGDAEKEKEQVSGYRGRKRHNLPVELTSLVGREAELAEIARLLEQPSARLLTLTGAGGCGKTRLALRTGRDLSGEYPHGAWLVELAPLSDPALLPQAVISALGLIVVPGTEPMDVLSGFFGSRRLLLILDNCEHLIDAVAALVIELMRTCPDLILLATSREPLSVPGEITYRVPSLALPPADWDGSTLAFGAAGAAAQLFLERAASVMPGYRLAEGDSPALAAICRRLDGIPLAIELAAARVSALPVSLIAARLEEGFRVLGHAGRGTMPRHATLRATVEWSCNLLSEPERVLLRRLPFFAGGWRLEQAEEVCSGPGLARDEVLDLLVGLVNKSLVVVECQPDGSARYRLHEMIRQYVRERLEEAGEGEELQARFIEYYTCLAEEAEPELKGPRQIEWLARLDPEKDNLTEALRLATATAVSSTDPLSALRLSAALTYYWLWRDQQKEGLRWTEIALAMMEGKDGATGAQTFRARALLGSLFLMRLIRPEEDARKRVLECVELYRSLSDRAGLALAFTCYFPGPEHAPEWTAELRALLPKLLENGDHWTAAFVLNALGNWERLYGDFQASETYMEQCIQQMRIAGDRIYYAHTMSLLCWLNWDVGKIRQGRDCLVEGLHILDEAGIRYSRTGLLHSLYQFEVALGNFAASQACIAESERLAKDLAVSPEIILEIHSNAAYIYFIEGRLEETRAECEQYMCQKGRIPDAWTLFLLGMALHYEGQTEQAARNLQESVEMMGQGGYQEVIHHALRGLGRVRLAQGEMPAARELFQRSLAEITRNRTLPDFPEMLDALACLAVADCQPEQAARLLGAAEELMARMEKIRYPVFRPEVECCREEACSKLGEAAYEQAYTEGWQAVRVPEPIEAIQALVGV